MSNPMHRLLLALLALALPLAARADAPDAEAQALAEEGDAVAAIQKALKAYVFISSRGSGVLISADGFILTNDHVAGSMPTWRVRTQDGTAYDARLVGTDPWGDIALLKIDGAPNLPYLELGDSDAMHVGESVIAIGNPFGMSNIDENPTVTTGIVSAVCRPQINVGQPDCVMTDAPLNPGNSGGPLIDMRGRVIGINGQIRTRHDTRTNSGIGYAISSVQIKRFLPVLKAANGGMVNHGWLTGLRYKGVPQVPHVGIEELFQYRGAYDDLVKIIGRADAPVSQVSDLAAAAGIQVGDVITAVDGHEVTTPAHAMARMASYPAESKLVLSVRRGEAVLEVPVTLGTMPLRGQADLALSFMSSEGERVEITAIAADSPAATSGLAVGDRIVSISGIELAVENARQLEALSANLRGPRGLFASFARTGAKIQVTVVREGKAVELALDVPKGVLEPGFTMGFPKTPDGVRPLQVRTVVDGGPAARAGVKEGDVVIGLSGEKGEQTFVEPAQLAAALMHYRPGQKVQLLVERDKERKVLDLTLGLKREMP